MIKNQIKSVLRNKSNKIYIVIFIILFTVLNILINMGKIIDSYYDSKMEELIGGSDEIEKYSRTVYANTEITLTEQEKEEIMKLKYVQDIETKIEDMQVGVINEETGIAELVDTKITMNYIIVDNWKYCKDVQNYFDSKGIKTSTLLGNWEFYENYETVKTFSNIITYILGATCVILLYISYKNILKNEEENLKLLQIMGYNKNYIRNIIAMSLITIIIISFVIALIIFKILLSAYISMSKNIVNNLVCNALVILLPLVLAIETKIKKLS